MDCNVLNSFRRISNIKFLAELTEKGASCQVINHVNNNNFDEKFQSAYKAHHSTETALLKVKSDISHSLDKNKLF